MSYYELPLAFVLIVKRIDLISFTYCSLPL